MSLFLIRCLSNLIMIENISHYIWELMIEFFYVYIKVTKYSQSRVWVKSFFNNMSIHFKSRRKLIVSFTDWRFLIFDAFIQFSSLLSWNRYRRSTRIFLIVLVLQNQNLFKWKKILIASNSLKLNVFSTNVKQFVEKSNI